MSSTATTTPVTTYTNDADINKFNRGAITTVFTPPSSCFVTPTLAGNGDWYLGHYRNSYYDPSCMPSSTSNSLSWDMYYYSPAISCPYSFFSASTVRNSFVGYQPKAVLSLSSDTSVFICCPTGYSVQYYDHVCTSTFVGTTTIKYFSPNLDQAGTWAQTSAVLTSTMTFVDKTPLIIYADGVPIWYQSSDQAAATTKTTSAPITTVTTNTGSTSPTTPLATVTVTTAPTNSSDANSGLSTGAKAGIGAGVGAVVLGIALFIAFIIFKRRKRSQYQAPSSAPTEIHDPKELQDTGLRPELHSTDIKELAGAGQPHQVHHQPSELAG